MYLSNNSITNISKLSNLDDLESLSLSNNEISSITTLRNLSNLRYLDLESNNISNISPISNLNNLEVLTLSSNEISDFEPLSQIASLSELNLSELDIDNLDFIDNLVNLNDLNLAFNSIQDISNLSNLINLKSLDLGDNNISDISNLKDLTLLTSLDLKNNSIKNISELSNLTELRYLNLDNNKISDVSSLATLNKLEDLYLNNNMISDISPVAPYRSNFMVWADNQTITINVKRADRVEVKNPIKNDKGNAHNIFGVNAGNGEIVSFDTNNELIIIENVNENSDKVKLSAVQHINNNIIFGTDLIISFSDAQIDLVTNTQDWTNDKVEISYDVISDKVNINKIILPDGSITTNETGVFEVESNGTYNFQAELQDGLILSQDITISNIDKTTPEFEFLLLDTTKLAKNNSVIFTIVATDNESGVEKIILPDNREIFVKPGENSITHEYTIDSAGNYTFIAYDRAGNMIEDTLEILSVHPNPDYPTINASDRTIQQGEIFNALDGVTAFDAQGTPITTINVIADNVKPNEPGRYSVTYEVTDSKGISARKTITITVVENTNTIAPPVINASGRTIEKGSSFDALTGVTALDCNGNDITDDIEVIYDNVNEHMVGRYTVTFRVADSNNIAVEKSITVTVIDSNKNDSMPIIEAYDLTIEKGTKFEPLKGVTATDGKGNDISNKLEVVFSSVNTSNVGTYNVTYQVKHNGVTSQKTITITVVNSYNIIPSITTNDLALIVGEAFNERDGVTATDKEDGDLTSKMIVTENNVDTSRPGTYMVKYSVTDSDGATTTFERTINVYEKEYKPVLKKKSDIILTVNQKYTILDYIEADDKTDSDINTKIRLLNHNVDITRAGVYTAEVQVTNSLGLTTIETFEIVVKDDSSGDNGSSNNNGSSNGSGSNNSGSSTSKPQTGDDLLIYSTGVLLSSSAIISINRKKKEK